MQPIRIGHPRVVGSRIITPVVGGDAGRYIRQPEFWVEYSTSDGLGDLDPALLVVPALGNLLPLAYAMGLTIEVEAVDAAFAAAAHELGPVFGKMYPSFRSDDFRLSGRWVSSSEGRHQGAALLFSGGLDSTASLIAHRDEVHELLTVWGADVDLADEGLWNQLRTSIERNPLTSGKCLVFAKSNLRDMIDGIRLTRRFETDFAHTNWWGGAQHGMALAAITAPIATMRNRATVYIAASHSERFSLPWGSTPTIDEAIQFAGAQVVHDQYQYDRQEKLREVVVPYLKQGGRLHLGVCYAQGRGAIGLNCGHCEKCIRTVSGLLCLGVDPNEVGIPMDQSSLSAGRRSLEEHSWHFGENELFMWAGILDSIPEDPSALWERADIRQYLGWLRSADLEAQLTPAPDGFPARAATQVRYAQQLILRRVPPRMKGFLEREVARRRHRSSQR